MGQEAFNVSYTDSIEDSIKTFNAIFQKEKQNALEALAKGAVTAARNALDKATTQWGYKRMAGRSGNSVFTPYGNSAGRNKTGAMMEDLGYSVDVYGDSTKITVGWVDLYLDYYGDQESGFETSSIFKGVRNGKPKFGKSKIRMKVDGAHSLEAAHKSIRNRKDSYMSGAWSAALAKYKGKRSPGTYLEARQRYYDSFTGDEVF